ncbi:hypothetical protein [Micromonospora sp. KC723]|uniref:hypothetical protein n=1 Tax=Micromonospora sp. KC723 TaxID=2530381 RepID=UPI001044F97D|nr:hypothetical protein [Micromonospora sp. KC723]TDB77969.1 hypothetical protein E1165_02355 [Micromonospora sp. KC723]
MSWPGPNAKGFLPSRLAGPMGCLPQWSSPSEPQVAHFVAPADRSMDRCHPRLHTRGTCREESIMRRSLPVLLSAVLSTLAVVGLHSSAAMARPAAAQASPGQTAAATSGTVAHTWFTGTLAAGATRNAVWRNVLTDHAYHVSLSPVGAGTSNACRFQVTRVWNEQRPEGNKDFWYTIQNIGSIACAANVIVYRIPGEIVRSTGGIAPGATKQFAEIAIDDWKIYRLGLLPSGSTSSDPCKLEVTRVRYTHRFQGDVATVFDLAYEVKNVGSITCQGDVVLGSTPIEHSWSIGALAPNWQRTEHWNNAPAATAFVPGVQPSLGCELELTGSHDVQVINSNGTVEREVHLTAKNVDTKTCDGNYTLASI